MTAVNEQATFDYQFALTKLKPITDCQTLKRATEIFFIIKVLIEKIFLFFSWRKLYSDFQEN